MLGFCSTCCENAWQFAVASYDSAELLLMPASSVGCLCAVSFTCSHTSKHNTSTEYRHDEHDDRVNASSRIGRRGGQAQLHMR